MKTNGYLTIIACIYLSWFFLWPAIYLSTNDHVAKRYVLKFNSYAYEPLLSSVGPLQSLSNKNKTYWCNVFKNCTIENHGDER